MGLLPLEFSDCLLDSPYFRENLKAHEKQLDQTSVSIKALIGGIQEVLDSAKLLIKAKRALADTLQSCQFDCLGTTLTDDEILISSSLKQFAKFLSGMEDEMNGILLQANEKFITPLLNFRKDQIGSVKNTKKSFDKATAKLCAAQERYVGLSGRKEESLAEAAETLRHETRSLNSSSLEYVHLMHVVQERKKFEFVEAIMDFTHSWVDYYKRGNAVACEQAEYMADLKSRVSKTRDNFSATVESYQSLKEKLLSSTQDPGRLNKMYTRQGYLFLQGKKNLKLGTGWSKHYCQYLAKTKTLTLIAYNQMAGKITTSESLRVTGCTCKDDVPEKFRFSVTGEDLTEAASGMITFTLQALSEFDRKNWVEALGGTWPAVNTLQRIRADSVEENLNSCAFTFLKDCLAELETRGLTDKGLYRVGGVISKVKKLLNQALDPQPGEDPVDMSDPKLWESKTLASAIKQYFRDLSKPLMTYQLYNNFLEAVKREDEGARLNEIYLVLVKLPRANREMLKVLVRHLSKVAANHEHNLMNASNLGVCFGPTLLRPREETVASIMDIKFCNEVIEIMIENCERFFPSTESSPELLHTRRPSMESGSESQSASSQADLPMSTPSTAPRVKRTKSFSSFSQLSTNSLPEIQEFSTATVDRKTDRPRSKSHQHEVPNVPRQGPSLGNLVGNRSKEQGPSVASLPGTRTKESSPAPTLPPRATTQADLMASLEMMNSLAADLPMASSPLRRSYTLNPKRMQRTGAGREVTRKPPLPKLAGVASSPTWVSNSPTSPQPAPSPVLHHHHTVPRHASQKSSPETFLRSPSLPRASRPTDLPSKLLSAFEGLCASPGARRRAETLSPSLIIEEEYTPQQPLKKTSLDPCVIQLGNNDEDNCSISSSHPSSYSHSPRANSEDLDLHYCQVTTSSPPSRPRAASSPPTDSGRATAQGVPQEDSLSILSCSLSEASEASGSKYDNVKSSSACDEPKVGEGTKETFNEDALSDSSNILDNLAEDSSGSDCGQYDCTSDTTTANHPPSQERMLDNQLISNNLRRNRDSGPYENVGLADQEIIVNNKKQGRLPNSMLDFVMVDKEGEEEGLVRAQRTGLHSLRNILTKGQTSNV